MKKIASVLMILSLFFAINVFAEEGLPEINVLDNERDIISVTGKTDVNARISLVILNPDKTENDLKTASDNNEDLTSVVAYMATVWPNSEGKYEFKINMYDSQNIGGGLYKFLVTEGSKSLEVQDYYFFFNDKKLDMIEKINERACVGNEDVVKEAYKVFGLSEYPLYKNGNVLGICSALDLLKGKTVSGKFDLNSDNFSDDLKRAALLAAYNGDNPSLITDEQGYVTYTDILKLKDTQEYTDYLNINSEGRGLLNSKLISKAYASLDDVVSEFRELVAFYGVEYYKEAGFGHLDSFFSNYESIFKKYGFKLDKINVNNKNSVYLNLMAQKKDNIESLAALFNSLVSSTGNNGYSGGSGSGGSGGGSAGNGWRETAQTPTNSYIVPKQEFKDLAGYDWAKSQIEALTQKGVISGRDENNYSPSDNVTRAEFIKMLMSTYDITTDRKDCPFSDVTDHWSRNYIMSAFDAGIAKGVTDTEFNPNGFITREDAAVLSARAMIYKGFELEADDTEFADDNEIQSYAKESVYLLKNAGIISGVGNNMFNPKGNLTRAEAAVIIYGIMLYK